jgi:hypothetical protein
MGEFCSKQMLAFLEVGKVKIARTVTDRTVGKRGYSNRGNPRGRFNRLQNNEHWVLAPK